MGLLTRSPVFISNEADAPQDVLDHVVVLDVGHFQRVVAEYVRYYNLARPPQGLGQKTPVPAERLTEGEVVALPVLSGLHHEYRRAA
jgi:putative transposase